MDCSTTRPVLPEKTWNKIKGEVQAEKGIKYEKNKEQFCKNLLEIVRDNREVNE